jgi:hypothetical protein
LINKSRNTGPGPENKKWVGNNHSDLLFVSIPPPRDQLAIRRRGRVGRKEGKESAKERQIEKGKKSSAVNDDDPPNGFSLFPYRSRTRGTSTDTRTSFRRSSSLEREEERKEIPDKSVPRR